MNWFRLYAEFASDAKVQSMSEVMQRRLIMLFCLNASGELASLDEEMIAFALRISDEELKETKRLFVKKGFITSEWTITNWEKRQYKSDSSTERVKRFRGSRDPKRNVSETLHETRVGESETLLRVRAPAQSETDTETEQTPPNPLKGEDAQTPVQPEPEPIHPKAVFPQSDIDAVARYADQLDPMGNWGPWVSTTIAEGYEPSWVRQAIQVASDAGGSKFNRRYVRAVLQGYARDGGPPKPRESPNRPQSQSQPKRDPAHDVWTRQPGSPQLIYRGRTCRQSAAIN